MTPDIGNAFVWPWSDSPGEEVLTERGRDARLQAALLGAGLYGGNDGEWCASAMIAAIPGGKIRQSAQQISPSASKSLWNQALAC